jgi:monoamine oxidase
VDHERPLRYDTTVTERATDAKHYNFAGWERVGRVGDQSRIDAALGCVSTPQDFLDSGNILVIVSMQMPVMRIEVRCWRRADRTRFLERRYDKLTAVYASAFDACHVMVWSTEPAACGFDDIILQH